MLFKRHRVMCVKLVFITCFVGLVVLVLHRLPFHDLQLPKQHLYGIKYNREEAVSSLGHFGTIGSKGRAPRTRWPIVIALGNANGFEIPQQQGNVSSALRDKTGGQSGQRLIGQDTKTGHVDYNRSVRDKNDRPQSDQRLIGQDTKTGHVDYNSTLRDRNDRPQSDQRLIGQDTKTGHVDYNSTLRDRNDRPQSDQRLIGQDTKTGHVDYNSTLRDRNDRPQSDQRQSDEKKNGHAAFTRWCQARPVALSAMPLPRTGLVSFPGSGNTWLRHLLQKMTGIGTSSVYCDGELRNKGFPFECHTGNQTLVVKTHGWIKSTRSQGFHDDMDVYSRLVLLLRNPYDAMLSYFHFAVGGHRARASVEQLRSAKSKLLQPSVTWYRNIVNVSVSAFKGHVLVVQYEAVKENMADELRKLARFLNVNVTQDDVDCAVYSKEGTFHRDAAAVKRVELIKQVFDERDRDKINTLTNEVETVLKNRFSNSNFDFRRPF